MSKRIISAVLAVVIGFAPVATAHADTVYRCPKWRKLAMQVGFSARDYKTLDYIIWRESRCAPTAINVNHHRDGKVTRDWGLTQVNDYSWITFLRNGEIVDSAKDLLNPKHNLKAARALYVYSKKFHDNPWLQWRTK
jgi:hypothetical protein